MLDIEEPPQTRNQSINNRHATVKRQLCNLRTRELAVCILEGNHSLVFEITGLVWNRPNAVVAGLLDIVQDWVLLGKLDGLRPDRSVFGTVRVLADDELAFGFAEAGPDGVGFADEPPGHILQRR